MIYSSDISFIISVNSHSNLIIAQYEYEEFIANCIKLYKNIVCLIFLCIFGYQIADAEIHNRKHYNTVNWNEIDLLL